MQYPSTWVKKASQNASSSDVVIFSPPDTTHAALRIIVSTGDMYKSIPLQQYGNAAVDILKNSYSDFNLISSDTTTLAGIPAQKILYTANLSSGLKIKAIQFFAINDTRFYVITSTAPANVFDAFLPTIQKMVSSFSVVSTTSTYENRTQGNATSITQTNKNDMNLQFLPYGNSTYGISIQYPSIWEKKESDDIVTFSERTKNAPATFVIEVKSDLLTDRIHTLDDFASSEIAYWKRSHMGMKNIEAVGTAIEGNPFLSISIQLWKILK